ncbi:MAG: hypothetical protein IKM57_08190 [Paludibacteraceae bacterium]|nr:hypothetical protein [Paludibacteraceae bacterium]
MKKIIIIAAMMLGFAVAAVAQPRAVGLRLGYGAEVTYQHTLGANFIEANFGLNTFNAINAAATYNWMIAQPQWTDRGEWGFYAGPGAAVGLGFGAASHFTLAATGQAGLEYTFWFPLQLSIDIRPQLGFWTGNKAAGFYFGGWCPALSVRYRF